LPAGVELSEWRLVGPGLAALLVALTLRFRLSRARIQEFLYQWLGLKLSIGTIHQTIHELSALEALMAAVYVARQGPPVVALPLQHAGLLAALRTVCEHHQGSLYPKAHALVVELLNDWKAIFQVLSHPELPLTNNEAERALRHWVILRKLSLGTRTATGSRVFALLASVIDICRQRGQSPWRYLERAIADRRAGHPPVHLASVGALNDYVVRYKAASTRLSVRLHVLLAQ